MKWCIVLFCSAFVPHRVRLIASALVASLTSLFLPAVLGTEQCGFWKSITERDFQPVLLVVNYQLVMFCIAFWAEPDVVGLKELTGRRQKNAESSINSAQRSPTIPAASGSGRSLGWPWQFWPAGVGGCVDDCDRNGGVA